MWVSIAHLIESRRLRTSLPKSGLFGRVTEYFARYHDWFLSLIRLSEFVTLWSNKVSISGKKSSRN